MREALELFVIAILTMAGFALSVGWGAVLPVIGLLWLLGWLA